MARRGTVSSTSVADPHLAARRVEADKVEIWESLTNATCWILVRDHVNGGWKHQRVGGPNGPRRIQLTVEERRFNSDMVPEENMQLDPFVNGQLLCVQGDARTEAQLTDQDIAALIAVEDDGAFRSTVAAIASELLLRRVLLAAERQATVERFRYVRDIVDTRYRVGGSQESIGD